MQILSRASVLAAQLGCSCLAPVYPDWACHRLRERTFANG
jgi:hypothetical protein